MFILGIIGIIILFSVLILLYCVKYYKSEDNSEKDVDHLIESCSFLIDHLKTCAEGDFNTLINAHKLAWTLKITPRSLQCDIEGKFRVSNIDDLDLDNIYIPIKSTTEVKSIFDWENNENVYKEVFYQYKNILLGSIGSYKQELIISKTETE